MSDIRNGIRAQAFRDAIAAIEAGPVVKRKAKDTGRDGAAKEGVQTGMMIAAAMVRALLAEIETP